MPGQQPIFAYDLGSPYAWLAAERVDALFPTTVVWLPVLLGAMFAAKSRSSWGEGPDRAAGMAEVERRASERGLAPVRWPDPWPSNGLQAMRAAVHATAEGSAREFALAAFRVHFCEGVTLSEDAGVRLAAERAELDPDAVIAATADPAVKDTLRENTDRALAFGVFGVPSIVHGGVVEWGDDRLEAALAAMSG